MLIYTRNFFLVLAIWICIVLHMKLIVATKFPPLIRNCEFLGNISDNYYWRTKATTSEIIKLKDLLRNKRMIYIYRLGVNQVRLGESTDFPPNYISTRSF